jgi:hypothetical protein
MLRTQSLSLVVAVYGTMKKNGDVARLSYLTKGGNTRRPVPRRQIILKQWYIPQPSFMAKSDDNEEAFLS